MTMASVDGRDAEVVTGLYIVSSVFFVAVLPEPGSSLRRLFVARTPARARGRPNIVCTYFIFLYLAYFCF